MAPKYVLNYFGVPGRAEPIRLLFHVAGVEFTDNHLSKADWTTLKSDSKLFMEYKIGNAYTLETTIVIFAAASLYSKIVCS